ncbi:MAG: chromosome partitioning protein ParB [Micavibrio sp.]|nr:chromosome partitioning protein ParB [Micavibrio sp.]
MAADDLNPKNRGLGRGLSALFEDDDVVDAESKTLVGSKRLFLPIEQLKPGVFQPRKDFAPQAIDTLADSVKKYGVLQPILVREISDYNYEIVAGERRWRAAQQAGLHEVPVVIKSLDDAVTLEIALIENLQREDLNPMEEADAYKQLMESFDHTQETLAESLGKSRTHIANTLRLLNLPDGVKAYVLTGKLTAGHARAVLSSSKPELLAEEIVKNKLSVREAEKRAQSGKAKKTSSASKTHKDVDTLALEHEMSERLGTKVEITLGKKGGKLVVHYNDFDQLDEFLHRLSYNRKTH